MKPIRIRIDRRIHGIIILSALLVFLLAGCATAPLKGNPDLLNFLSDGKTTRIEAITRLGQPSGRFEADKLLSFRLGYDERTNGYYVVEREAMRSGWPTWKLANFSLVLVFDDLGVLKKHALVKVNE